MPTISILVPCRNAERYLAATLDSALQQSLPATEVLVVDDGSTDRSARIAASYAPAVAVVSNPRIGVSAARNHGTSLARGEFVQYLDADDLLESHAIESRVDELRRTGADLVISDWQRMTEHDGNWEVATTESGRLPADGLPADLQVFRGFWAPPAAMLYRRSLCERIGGWRETLPVIQDARFLLDAARVGGRIAHVPGVGARYRQHGTNSLSTRGPADFWRDVLRNTQEVEALWRTDNRVDVAHLSAIAAAYGHCARVGFVHDRDLFEAGLVELNRFPEFGHPRFLRVASVLTRVVGYDAARAVVSRLGR